MKYRDSVEKSAEFLRLALPLMTKQAAALHPVSYAVWYEYVSGGNAALNASIDEYMQKGGVLDEKSTWDIFRKHVSEIDEETAQRITEGFQKVMADMAGFAGQAGDQADHFGNALGKWSSELASTEAGAGLGGSVDAILDLTRNMQGAIVSLKGKLDESRHEIEQLQIEVTRAREESLVDSLTGLRNRRGFEMAMSSCLSDQVSDEDGPSLLIADIDNFKGINDTYGHLFGDKVLQTVAKMISDNVKGKDATARYGGEEFAILLPGTPLDGARNVAEKIRAAIEKCRVKRTTDNESLAHITISLGVACRKAGEAATDFFARADAALYASKNQGRNRVTVAPV